MRCIFDTTDFRVCYNLHNFGADVTKAVGVKKGQTHIQEPGVGGLFADGDIPAVRKFGVVFICS